MATTQADLDRLIAARNAGVTRVRTGDGKEVDYLVGADMDRAIAAARGELARSTGTFHRHVRISTSKGL